MKAPAFFAATAFVLAGTMPAGADDAAPATIVEAAPGASARAHRLLPWRDARAGRALRMGTDLMCPAGCTIVLMDGIRVALAPGAVVSVLDATFVRVHAGDSAVRAPAIAVAQGGVSIRVPERARHPLAVFQGDRAIAVVEPGVSRVERTRAGVIVGVDEGASAVAAGRSFIDLRAGQASTIRASGATPPRQLVTAPSWAHADSRDAPIAFVSNSPFASVGVGWTGVAGASRYEVEIASDPSFSRIADRGGATDTGYRTRPLRPGAYFARVRAVDPDGLGSAFSAARLVQVAELDMPAGGRVDGAVLTIPDGEHAHLRNPSELEIAAGRSGFVRARGDLPLFSGPTDLRVRIPGDASSETSFRVDQRGLSARVAITPKLPRWPTDPIAITVTLEDPTGHVDAVTVTPILRVLVGVDEAFVDWSQHGAAWSTHLSPRAAHVPQVVRVIATDDAGKVLGRGFVEVDVSPQAPDAALSRR